MQNREPVAEPTQPASTGIHELWPTFCADDPAIDLEWFASALHPRSLLLEIRFAPRFHDLGASEQ